MPTLIDILEQHRSNPKDGRIFGLVIQGGGMRAAYSAGAIAPLVTYGFSGTFEHVIGSCAGAINGAYFVTADGTIPTTYTDDLTNKNFVNPLRPGKVVDIDYLLIWGLKSVGISPYIGFFISGIFFTFWSFAWYKYWVFPESGGAKLPKA